MADVANITDSDLKRCYTCREMLPRSAFAIKRQAKDGRNPYCKPCDNAKLAVKRATDPMRAEKAKAKHEYDQARYKERRAEILLKCKVWYEGNRQRAKATASRWCKANPERRRDIANSYKSRRRAVEGDGISGAELGRWSKAQAKVCYWCGSKCARKFHVDHYHPLSKGGAHEVSNLVIACPSCNLRKSAKDPIAFAHEIGRLL